MLSLKDIWGILKIFPLLIGAIMVFFLKEPLNLIKIKNHPDFNRFPKLTLFSSVLSNLILIFMVVLAIRGEFFLLPTLFLLGISLYLFVWTIKGWINGNDYGAIFYPILGSILFAISGLSLNLLAKEASLIYTGKIIMLIGVVGFIFFLSFNIWLYLAYIAWEQIKSIRNRFKE